VADRDEAVRDEVVRDARVLPARFAERARRFAAGDLDVVAARPAATVILLQDTRAGIEAYMLRRRTTMAFAAGMYAFPGGGVDVRDVAGEVVSWSGPDVGEWARRLGTDYPAARGFVCAAVRETFEEANVLLTDPNVAPSGPEWDSARRALVNREQAFSQFLERRGLAIRSDLLAPWAHWITPRFEERRFDTWFFVASVPPGQDPQDVSGEADRAVWVRPADAVTAAQRGEVAMLPPTRMVLSELASFGSVKEVKAAAAGRLVEAIMPAWRDDGDAVRVLLPGDPGFPGDDNNRPVEVR
jgi:8-oxo-dGTP pyrophosphatase MutT (NUDIX family)